MNPIRPTLTPNIQPQAAAKPVDAARAAAQKAFFEIALGKTPPAAAAAPVQSGAAAAVQRMTRAQPPADPPAQPLRPGSLLDIRV